MLLMQGWLGTYLLQQLVTLLVDLSSLFHITIISFTLIDIKIIKSIIKKVLIQSVIELTLFLVYNLQP